MHDPVVTASGFTFERMAIEEWLKAHDTCPLTSAPLPSKVRLGSRCYSSRIVHRYLYHLWTVTSAHRCKALNVLE